MRCRVRIYFAPVVLICACLLQAPSAMAESLSENCSKVAFTESSFDPPDWFGRFLFSFERDVALAFPIGSDAAVLKDWLAEERFGFYGMSYLESAFVDEPDESSRTSERIKNDQRINLASSSWNTICGGISFSVGWVENSCAAISEICADVEYCQFDLP